MARLEADKAHNDAEEKASDPVDVPGGEGDGVLVDKADSSGEDSAVFGMDSCGRDRG